MELNVREFLGLILGGVCGGFFLYPNIAIQSFFNLSLLMSYGYCDKFWSLTNAVSEGILSNDNFCLITQIRCNPEAEETFSDLLMAYLIKRLLDWSCCI